MLDAPLSDTEAIDALGGTVAASKLFKVRPSVVSNWRKRGIPGRYHYVAVTICQAHGVKWTPPEPRQPLTGQQP